MTADPTPPPLRVYTCYIDGVLHTQPFPHGELASSSLEAELVGRDCPDHIFIADTTGDDTWSLFQPVTDRLFSIDMGYVDVVPPAVPAQGGGSQ